MVKNTTGGSGHKGQSSRENPRIAKNRRLADAWISDLGNTFPAETLLGRITKRLGTGRYEVFAQGPSKRIHPTLNVPLRGSMCGGKGKHATFVGVDSLVLIAETGLAGTTHEIVGLFEPGHIRELKKVDELDPRFFAAPTETAVAEEGGYEFTEEVDEEVDVDAI
jgi:hypothetical protein